MATKPAQPLDKVIAFHEAFGEWYEYTGGQHPPPETLSKGEQDVWGKLRRRTIEAWENLQS